MGVFEISKKIDTIFHNLAGYSFTKSDGSPASPEGKLGLSFEAIVGDFRNPYWLAMDNIPYIFIANLAAKLDKAYENENNPVFRMLTQSMVRIAGVFKDTLRTQSGIITPEEVVHSGDKTSMGSVVNELLVTNGAHYISTVAPALQAIYSSIQ